LPWDRREADRRYRLKNREAILARRAALRHEKLAQEGPASERSRGRRSAHGSGFARAFAKMWDEQGGQCYLCGDELTPAKAEVDHDHACCPPGKSCDACRRGLACTRCNRLIGQVQDDPELLRRIAGNLESRASVVRLRIAAKPVQLEITLPGVSETESAQVSDAKVVRSSADERTHGRRRVTIRGTRPDDQR
jgi:Recombination endonuclease VII